MYTKLKNAGPERAVAAFKLIAQPRARLMRKCAHFDFRPRRRALYSIAEENSNPNSNARFSCVRETQEFGQGLRSLSFEGEITYGGEKRGNKNGPTPHD